MDVLWTIVLGLVNAVIVGVFVRRLINVGTGALRNTLVSLVMGLSIWPVSLQAFEMLEIVQRGDVPFLGMSFPAVMVFLLIFAWFVAIQLFVMLAIELVLPSGSFSQAARTVSRLPTWYRRLRRIGEIQNLLIRFGLRRYLRPRIPSLRVSMTEIAQAAAQALAAAGVTFVKLGQFVATRADMIPAEFVEEFSRLQSEVPAVAFAEIRPEIERQWGRPIEDVCREFDEKPLAAASVAQVHRAVLRSGEEVVVKVQRPNLRRQVRADSDIIMSLAERFEKTASWAQTIGLTDIARGFLDSLSEELDYRGEIRQTLAMREDLGAQPGSLVRIPEVFVELSGRQIIVMERMPGRPLTRGEDVLGGLSMIARREAAEQLFVVVARQMLESGVFHADLHAGNIMVSDAARVGLIDFGAVGRLDSRDRRDVLQLLLAFERQNSLAATNAVIDLFGMPPGLDLRQVQREIGQIMLRYDGGVASAAAGTADGFGGAASGFFRELLSFILSHGFTMPSAVAQAFRAITTLEDSLRRLDPHADLLGLVREHGRDLLAGTRDVRGSAQDAALYAGATAPVLANFPVELSRVVKHLQDGTLDIGTSGLNIDLIRNLVRTVVDQLVQVVLATALVLGGVIMMAFDFGPPLATGFTIFTYFGAWLLLGGMVLAAIVLAPALRDRRAEL
ncbi:ABC1 kinase family protein [Brevibacterium yomogidense]|uniref:Ubiquinone biosynthesis monooxygenase UbiB n=1 Tax=Brevibacterium yomogidense TaxID=946573 RepID=A0A1X6XKS2_9MICO|nr:AarF/UbiB family protein [Brevibacterium yomogidense]SLM99743.1 Ubiquinone biosynthesis monooxygenase UbiB [Brevibacterium yomogidense]